jgi:hypothetical protein
MNSLEPCAAAMNSLEPCAAAMKRLEDAAKHVQLAVDLIELLEQSEVDPQLALDALAIVTDDCRRKLKEKSKAFTTETRRNGEKQKD